MTTPNDFKEAKIKLPKTTIKDLEKRIEILENQAQFFALRYSEYASFAEKTYSEYTSFAEKTHLDFVDFSEKNFTMLKDLKIIDFEEKNDFIEDQLKIAKKFRLMACILFGISSSFYLSTFIHLFLK